MPNKVSETVSLKPQSMHGGLSANGRGPSIATHLVGEQALSVRLLIIVLSAHCLSLHAECSSPHSVLSLICYYGLL